VASYDAALHSRDPRAPVLGPPIAAAFEAGEVAVIDPAAPRATPRIALRMPWDEGPCAVMLVAAPRAIVAGGLVRDVGLALGVLALAVLVAVVVLRPPLQRLDRLADAVDRAGATAQLSVPDDVRGSDEVGVLAEALARSAAASRAHLAALETKDRALRDYVDGTTHDLALPLTVLLGHLSALDAAASAGEPASAAEVAGAVASANYLAQLAANLAAAARLEGGEPMETRPVDLGALSERVAARLRPIAVHRGIELAVATPDRPVLVPADELLLERALANLVHNAIRHGRRDRDAGSTPAGHVAVVVSERGLTVKNDGDPVPPEVIAALRDGETPPDVARTRGRGLGLTIVRKVAALHHMTVAFTPGDDGGLEVSLLRA
jgi:signal transduction histidine kinase